jgi:hypothetical protein
MPDLKIKNLKKQLINFMGPTVYESFSEGGSLRYNGDILRCSNLGGITGLIVGGRVDKGIYNLLHTWPVSQSNIHGTSCA